MKVYMSI